MIRKTGTKSGLIHGTLDATKNKFIEAGKKTVKFAENLASYQVEFWRERRMFFSGSETIFKKGVDNLYITLLPEGLGTSDDAPPHDGPIKN